MLNLEWGDGAICDYFSHSQQSLAASQTEYSLKEWCKIFKKPRNNFEILGVKRVTCSKFHTEAPHILGTTVQNLFATLFWHPGFVHPCIMLFTKVRHVRNTLITSKLIEVKWVTVKFLGTNVPCIVLLCINRSPLSFREKKCTHFPHTSCVLHIVSCTSYYFNQNRVIRPREKVSKFMTRIKQSCPRVCRFIILRQNFFIPCIDSPKFTYGFLTGIQIWLMSAFKKIYKYKTT